MKLLKYIAFQKNKLFNQFDDIASQNRITNIYGLSRSLFALSLLITLLFSEVETLFAQHLFDNPIFSRDLLILNYFKLFKYEYLWLAKIPAILFLIVVILGYYPRYTCIIHWWLSFSFFQSASIIDGGDQIITVMTFYLIPIGLMDGRKNHWNINSDNNRYKNFISYFLFLIMQIQTAILYLQAGIEKPYKVDEWRDGTAIYYWFNNNTFGGPQWIMSWLNPLLEFPLIISILTWGTIIFELVLFGAFFMKKELKSKILPIAIIFHFSILLIHGLASFFFAISGALIIYLLPSDTHLNFKSRKHD